MLRHCDRALLNANKWKNTAPLLQAHPSQSSPPGPHGYPCRTWKTGRLEELKVTGTQVWWGWKRVPSSPACRLAQRPPPGLTCDVQVEGDLLAPGLAAVFPGIRLARLLHHQPPGAALGFHTHFRAGTQLLPVLVPRHLRLGLGHLAAQRGTRPRHGLYLLMHWLPLDKHCRGLWAQRGIHKVRDTNGTLFQGIFLTQG